MSVLWIGRMLFAPSLRVREIELARRIAKHTRVFALDRSEALSISDNSFRARLKMRWRLIMCHTQVLSEGELTRFRMPVWAATGPVFNRVAAALNERRIAAMAARFKCDWVFHGKPFFFMPEKPGRRPYRVHFDVIDNFYDEWPEDSFVGRSRRAFLQEAMKRADTLSACSLSLCDYTERITGRKAAYSPNGAARQNLLSCAPAQAQAVREKLGLQGRFVLGFIGNHLIDWDGMERVLDALAIARKRRPELALLIVGPGADRVPGPRGLGPADGVHVVGPVKPDEVPAYMWACDAGLHPYDPRPVSEDALPLNVVEFSTCGKPMLCNPLRELKRQAWPNLRFAQANAAAWGEALSDPATFAPFDKEALTRLVEICDWDKSAEVIRAQMEEA